MTFAPYLWLNCCRLLCFEALIALVAVPYALLPLAFCTIYFELLDLPPLYVVEAIFFFATAYDIFADQISVLRICQFRNLFHFFHRCDERSLRWFDIYVSNEYGCCCYWFGYRMQWYLTILFAPFVIHSSTMPSNLSG